MMGLNYLGAFNVDLVSNQASVSASDTHKTWNLKSSQAVPLGYHLMIGIETFNMPYSYYDIRENNNTFTVTVGAVTEQVVIPYGNYSSANQFATALNVQFSILTASLGLVIVVTADNVKKKFLFTPSIATTITFSNILPYRQFGFDLNEEFVFSGASYATNGWDFSGSPNLYVRMINKGIQNLNSKNNFTGIMTSIEIDGYPNDLILYKNTQPQLFKTAMKNVNTIEIELLDENMESIPSLNGGVWRIGLVFMYQKDHDVPQSEMSRYNPDLIELTKTLESQNETINNINTKLNNIAGLINDLPQKN